MSDDEKERPAHWFKKGNKLGVGRPPVDPELKKARKLTKTKAAALFEIFMHKSVTELDKICKDPKTTVLEAMIARVAQQAIRDGDQRRLDFMLDRTIGKVKEQLEVKLPKPMIVENLEGPKTLLGAKEGDTLDAEVLDDD